MIFVIVYIKLCMRSKLSAKRCEK